jgi:hypothetical protein
MAVLAPILYSPLGIATPSAFSLQRSSEPTGASRSATVVKWCLIAPLPVVTKLLQRLAGLPEGGFGLFQIAL